MKKSKKNLKSSIKRCTKKRNKLKYKNQRNKTRKQGGDVGKGTFGTVYFNPRPVCENEEFNQGLYNEAAKLDTAGNTGELDSSLFEFKKLDFLREKGINLDELSQYVNLPLKNCLVNKDIFDIKDNNRKQIYDFKWLDYDTSVISRAIQGTKQGKTRKFQTMTVYPLMQKDFSKITQYDYSYDNQEFLQILLTLRNLYNGLIYLYNNNLHYADLKEDNIMLSRPPENVMKIIDCASLKWITNDPKQAQTNRNNVFLHDIDNEFYNQLLQVFLDFLLQKIHGRWLKANSTHSFNKNIDPLKTFIFNLPFIQESNKANMLLYDDTKFMNSVGYRFGYSSGYFMSRGRSPESYKVATKHMNKEEQIKYVKSLIESCFDALEQTLARYDSDNDDKFEILTNEILHQTQNQSELETNADLTQNSERNILQKRKTRDFDVEHEVPNKKYKTCLIENRDFMRYVIDGDKNNISFKDCVLKNVIFHSSKIQNVDFTNAKFENCVFTYADIRGCNFTHTTFKDCVFYNVDIDNIVKNNFTFDEFRPLARYMFEDEDEDD